MSNTPHSPSWLQPHDDMSATGLQGHPMPQPVRPGAPDQNQRDGHRLTGARHPLDLLARFVLALVFGYVAKKQIRESGGLQQGGGLATAGIVLGWVGVGVLGIVAIVAIIGYAVG